MKSLDRQTGAKLGEAEGDVKGSAGGSCCKAGCSRIAAEQAFCSATEPSTCSLVLQKLRLANTEDPAPLFA